MNKCQYCDKQTEITYWNGFTCLCKECYKLFFGTLKTARKEEMARGENNETHNNI